MKSITALEKQKELLASPLSHPVIQDASINEIQRFISRPQFTVRHTVTQACEFEKHAHAAYTVTTLLAGRLIATIGDEIFELAPGQTAFTNVGQNHSARGEHVGFISVALSPTLVNEIVSEIG